MVVFRFYALFQITSPMSWGAWILTFIYPISILQILSTLRRGYSVPARFVDRSGIGRLWEVRTPTLSG